MMTLNDYVVKDGKRLRIGYTTGSCSAAAAKAATAMLFGRCVIANIDIEIPEGRRLKLEVMEPRIGENWAMCGIKKDGGDDPDVTSGLVIYAKAQEQLGDDITLVAGEGVGKVTKKGLQVEPGQPAINPVPLAMIRREVGEVKPPGKGVEITLSIPGGEKAAKGTFNPKLGIAGGLSILGTTGIVEPMSVEALKKTLDLEISVLAARGKKRVVLVPGNYGKRYAIESGEDPRDIISFGNFLGFMLEKTVEHGFSRIKLLGDLGKLVKVAAGIFNTAGRVADARVEIMAAYAAAFGAKVDVTREILSCTTTGSALEIIEDSGVDMQTFYKFVTRRVVDRCLWYSGEKIEICAEVYTQDRGLLARASSTDSSGGRNPW